MLFTLYKLDMHIEYKGYTFIYIIYKCWPMSIFNMLLFNHTRFNSSHREGDSQHWHLKRSSEIIFYQPLTQCVPLLCCLLLYFLHVVRFKSVVCVCTTEKWHVINQNAFIIHTARKSDYKQEVVDKYKLVIF